MAPNANVSDWTFLSTDGLLYGGINNIGFPTSDILILDPLTGVSSIISGTGLPGGGYGVAFSIGDGFLYLIEGGSSIIYRVLISGTSFTAVVFSQTTAASTADGAACINAILEIDFGDAPDINPGNGPGNYNTLLANNGPRHGIEPNLMLGSTITGENDAYQNATATGDDLILGIQDDLIGVMPTLLSNQTTYTVPIIVTNNTGTTANLYGWVDINENGLFDGDEAQTTTVPSILSGTQTVNMTFTIPSNVVLPPQTFARFRLTTDVLQNANAGTPTLEDTRSVGPAGDGEVEDWRVNVEDVNIISTKTVSTAYANLGDTLTYTVTLKNGSSTATVSNVTFTDPLPSGVTYVGGLIVSAPFTGSDPMSGLTFASLAPNQTVSITWNVMVDPNTLPSPNPVINVGTITVPNALPSTTPQATTQINHAVLATVKTVDAAYAKPNQTLTYTLTVSNSGNVPANNVIITDVLPAGVSFVAGSLVNATGTPPTLTLTSPVPAGGSVIVSYKVLVGSVVPNPNPVENSASAVFAYTVNPSQPNGATGTSYSNVVETLINTAKLLMKKSTDKTIAYLDDTITYQISLTNTGNVPANNVVITDLIPTGTVLVPGSMTVSVPYTTLMGGAIALTNPVAPGQTVTISFKILVVAIPNPNPIVNVADATFTYTVDPEQPDEESGVGKTNEVTTIVFRNNYGQQISDLIHSVALEQAALAAIANAEGAKIQRMVAMSNVTPAQLVCLNKSVTDMMDSIALLEAVLKQKLGVVACQIDGETC